ncbi:MAG: hypothetical protein IPL02_09230 [Moraxellaceae bacterium]|nr:hypothetical protein [Moraxellaceae bacterium]
MSEDELIEDDDEFYIKYISGKFNQEIIKLALTAKRDGQFEVSIYFNLIENNMMKIISF